MFNNDNQNESLNANIKIIGVGGGGNNSVESMIKSNIKGVDFVIANTDSQVLKKFDQSITIHLGNINDRKGLGAGAKPEIGREAAVESESQIKEKLKGADMVIVAAGMGGGTGTGAAPIVAKAAKSMGALTIGIVTTPFKFEGAKRMQNALEGVDSLRKEVDSLIIISNEKLRLQYGSIPLKDSFIYADTVLKQTVKTLTDIISVPALINLDFADVTTVMKDKGNAIVGIGRGNGKERAKKAALNAISSPILEVSVKGAKDMIINITGGDDFSLDEANEIVDLIQETIGSDVNIIFGVSIDETMEKEVSVSIIATGLREKNDESFDVSEHFNHELKTLEEETKVVEEPTMESHIIEETESIFAPEATVEENDLDDEDFPSEEDFITDEFDFEKTTEEQFNNGWITEEERVETPTPSYAPQIEFPYSHTTHTHHTTNSVEASDEDDLDDEDLDNELPAFLKR